MDKLKTIISEKESNAKQKCDKRKEHALKTCQNVNYLLEAIEKLGCSIKDKHKFFRSAHCDGEIMGGFLVKPDGSPSVVLCQNNLQDQLTVNLTMAHELVHAYDECRGKVNWSNCLHYACSEVRAAALSGDCDWRNEFLRGNRTIAKQHQACVRRRAALSLSHVKACQGKEDSCVDKVFENCYRDTMPFGKIP